MRRSKKPKYKFDVKKFDLDKIEKKEKDPSIEESYREYLMSKIRKRRR